MTENKNVQDSPPPKFALGFDPSGVNNPVTYGSSSDTVVNFFQNLTCSATGDTTTTKGPPTSPGSKDFPPTKILDFLFLGTINDAQDVSFIQQNGITDIINVATQTYWAPVKDVRIHSISMEDSSSFNVETVLDKCFEKISRIRQWHYAKRYAPFQSETEPSSPSGNPPSVLIHCERGISRSPTIVIAYLVLHNGWTVTEALRFVQDKRMIVSPNCGFLEQLRAYEQSEAVQQVRLKHRALLGVVLRNVSTSCSEQVIHNYFETTVGIVWDVKRKDKGDGSVFFLVLFSCAEQTKLAKWQTKALVNHPLGAEKGKVLISDLPGLKKERPSQRATDGDDGPVGNTDQGDEPPLNTSNTEGV